MKLRRDFLFCLPLTVLILGFLGPVIVLQKSFVAADFSVQHWPWARYFYEALRAGQFPFWTEAMTAGFPLVAEGQIAAFYGPHRLLASVLPFWAFYSWSIVLHFLAGALGWYAYARSIRISRAGSGFAALVYAFGSTYAGCYYNTGSLRTLAWLPLVLWLLERMPQRSRRERIGQAALLALAVSQMWNAGFAQIALYAMGFAFLAALLRVRRPAGAETLLFYTASAVAGTLLAMPQMVLSWELIGQSVRQGESIAFALWGSMPPTGLIGLLFPEWGNVQRLSLYLGVPAAFAALAFMSLPRARKDWRPVWLLAIFLFLALGKYNPLYEALIKGLNLTFLRNPSKFLFFAAAAFSLTAGQGLDAALLALRRGRAKPFLAPAIGLAALAVVLPAFCRLVWTLARPAWTDLSARMIASVVSEKGGMAQPAAHYERFMASFYEQLGTLFSYTHTNTLATVLLATACAALVAAAVRGKIARPVFLVLFFALAVVDFHHYGWHLGSGFIGNAGRVDKTRADARIEFLQKLSAADPGPIAEFVLDPADEFLPPNRTMAYGLAHAGGYSPLLLKDYYDLTRDLGIVDGSLGRAPFSEEVWRQNRGVLDLIGLKYLASDARLEWPGFEDAGRVGNTFFYRNRLALPPAAAWTHAVAIADPAERLRYLKSAAFDPRSIAVVERDPGLPASPGTGVFSNAQIEDSKPGSLRAIYTLPADGIGGARIAAYPGWVVRVDGEVRPWFRVNHAFVGFRLEAGSHLVEINYVPNRYREALTVSALAGLLALAAAFRFFLAAKPL